MDKLIVEFKSEILNAISFSTLPFLAFMVSMGVVYLFGRMLNVVKSDRGKNFIAFLSLVAVHCYYFYFIDPSKDVPGKVWMLVIYTSLSILFYVLIGFRMYDRIEQMLDKLTKTNTKSKRKK